MNVVKESQTKTNAPLMEIFSHLGRPCTVPLIFALGERSYNTNVRELRESFDTSIGKKPSVATISKCLSDLAGIGLVEGPAHADSTPLAEYCLTVIGQQVYRHLIQMKHLAERANSEETFIDSVSAC
jgi:DNA-binding HxlR family transcriptional regulator